VIRLGFAYVVAGLMFLAFAVLSARDRKTPGAWARAAFWLLVAVSFLAGDLIGDLANGVLVVGLALLAGTCRLTRHGHPETTRGEREASAERLGNRLFIPALIVPATAVLGALFLKKVMVGGRPLIEPGQAALVSLALGAVIALLAAMAMLRPRPMAALQEGRRLADMVSWAGLLPQALAALGVVFTVSGVGKEVGALIESVVPLHDPTLAVAAYTCGMALFTILLGNAFAAFPVMTAAIGLPVIVHRFGGDPVIMGAIGMLSGFCGTLVTPMAANFNIVPTALLELGDRWAVIRTQAPTAAALLIVNTALMAALVYRF
jgi:uncharacterized membrane protein